MDNVRNITQAYSLVPWRKQIQAIVTFLLFLVCTALIAGVYLSVSARAVTEGHEVQLMHRKIQELAKQNADLGTTLAIQTSTSVMESRAVQMGFEQLKEGDILYLEVPGYRQRREAVIAPPPGRMVITQPVTLAPAFTESLVDWLRNRLENSTRILVEVRP